MILHGEEPQQTVTLRASSLYSKWGFSDGDVLNDMNCIWGIGSGWEGGSSELLIALVEEHLLPLLPGMEIDHIATCHNPIRARDYDPGEHESYEDRRVALDKISVTISSDQVVAMMERILLAKGKASLDIPHQNGQSSSGAIGRSG